MSPTDLPTRARARLPLRLTWLWALVVALQGCVGFPGHDIGLIRTEVTRSAEGRNEYIVTGPAVHAEALRELVEALGGRVQRGSDQPALGLASVMVTFANPVSLDRAAREIAARYPEAALSPNWLYRFAQSQPARPRLYASALVGDPGPGRCRLARPVRIGMIDGPVNAAHPALRAARVQTVSLVPGQPVPSADHGTAVATLIAGEDPSGILAGFARGAELHAVEVFSLEGGRDATTVERVIAALDLLAGRDVRLINMSFSGPRSPAMQQAMVAATARGIVLVAASGNEGQRQVAWPAESDRVIAVSAVDSAVRLYRWANTGPQVEFAGPGVDLYLAHAVGGRYGSGTSFASPIVASLIAREMARGTDGAEALRARLRAAAVGPEGAERTVELGWGLARATAC